MFYLHLEHQRWSIGWGHLERAPVGVKIPSGESQSIFNEHHARVL